MYGKIGPHAHLYDRHIRNLHKSPHPMTPIIAVSTWGELKSRNRARREDLPLAYMYIMGFIFYLVCHILSYFMSLPHYNIWSLVLEHWLLGVSVVVFISPGFNISRRRSKAFPVLLHLFW